MVAPDPSVLPNGLTKMAAQVSNHHPDPLFRTQMVRSTLHVDNRPTERAVMECHKRLGWAQVAKKGGSGNRALKISPGEG